ncbi:hypothetical protein HPB51_005234 [Rhipicephalus microplus]|uniref:Uncharacterized protein n=1 Tax=Rhipicephalus microplus TaxID=6941 RepID=A0A9J6EY47_RHIMP|nr:hypothetical protein HPB51_005234 [Rhipicephalus microplus]
MVVTHDTMFEVTLGLRNIHGVADTDNVGLLTLAPRRYGQLPPRLSSALPCVSEINTWLELFFRDRVRSGRYKRHDVITQPNSSFCDCAETGRATDRGIKLRTKLACDLVQQRGTKERRLKFASAVCRVIYVSGDINITINGSGCVPLGSKAITRGTITCVAMGNLVTTAGEDVEESATNQLLESAFVEAEAPCGASSSQCREERLKETDGPSASMRQGSKTSRQPSLTPASLGSRASLVPRKPRSSQRSGWRDGSVSGRGQDLRGHRQVVSTECKCNAFSSHEKPQHIHEVNEKWEKPRGINH